MPTWAWILMVWLALCGLAVFLLMRHSRNRSIRQFEQRRRRIGPPITGRTDDVAPENLHRAFFGTEPEVTSSRFLELRESMLDGVIRKSKEFDGDMVKAAEALGHPPRIANALADEIARLAGEPVKMPPNMGGVGNPPYQGPNYFDVHIGNVSRDYRSDEQIRSGQFGRHPRRDAGEGTPWDPERYRKD